MESICRMIARELREAVEERNLGVPNNLQEYSVNWFDGVGQHQTAEAVTFLINHYGEPYRVTVEARR